MSEAHRLARPAGAAPGDGDRLADERPRTATEAVAAKADQAGRELDRGPLQFASRRPTEEVRHLACLSRQPPEGLVEPGIDRRPKPREEIVSQPVSRERQVSVARVCEARLANLYEIGLHFRPRDVEERPNQPHFLGEPPPPWNAAQAAKAGPAKELKNDRLCLVVAGVGRGHKCTLMGLGDTVQEIVSDAPGGLFDTTTSRCSDHTDITAFSNAPDAVRSRLGDYPLCVPCRLLSEAVVEVSNDNREVEIGRDGERRAEEGRAVSPARNRQHKAAAYAEVAVFLCEPIGQ